MKANTLDEALTAIGRVFATINPIKLLGGIVARWRGQQRHSQTDNDHQDDDNEEGVPRLTVPPPGTPGSVWLAQWERVRIDPTVADGMERVIAQECGRIDPNDWR